MSDKSYTLSGGTITLLASDIIAITPSDSSLSSMFFNQVWGDEDDIRIGQELVGEPYVPIKVQISALHLEIMARVRIIKKKHCE